MTAQELTLNIAVNLGRVSRWAIEGKRKRIDQFLHQTEGYVDELERSPMPSRFEKTFRIFKERFDRLKTDVRLDGDWAEESLTWANILTHRAKLAGKIDVDK